MESWRRVWREGAAPLLETPLLEALKKALETDDPKLVQGSTTVPPPLQCVGDWPVEAGCLLGYCGAISHGGFGTAKVCEAEEFMGRLCFEIDQRLGEPAGCRWLLNFFDETPRDVMRPLLLEEVTLELSKR